VQACVLSAARPSCAGNNLQCTVGTSPAASDFLGAQYPDHFAPPLASVQTPVLAPMRRQATFSRQRKTALGGLGGWLPMTDLTVPSHQAMPLRSTRSITGSRRGELESKRDIGTILKRCAKDPVSPEFMAPPLI